MQNTTILQHYSKSFKGQIPNKENESKSSNMNFEQKSCLMHKYRPQKSFEPTLTNKVLNESRIHIQKKLQYDYKMQLNTSSDMNKDCMQQMKSSQSKRHLTNNLNLNRFQKQRNQAQENFAQMNCGRNQMNQGNQNERFLQEIKKQYEQLRVAQKEEKINQVCPQNQNRQISQRNESRDLPLSSNKVNIYLNQMNQYKKKETEKVVKSYSKNIISNLKAYNLEYKLDFLDKHQIPANLRAKMVDWMVEVLSSYKCQEQTFFLAVNIMDDYLAKSKKVNDVTDLHLIGVTSMFMASKFEEIYPLKLSIVYEKIAHKKLSKEQILMKEQEIINTLQFDLNGPTLYEFVTLVLSMLQLDRTTSEKCQDYLQRVCLYLSKMVMHDYKLICKQSLEKITAATIFVAFKIIEQLDQDFPVQKKTLEVREILNVNDEDLYENATNILNVAKNFERIYPNLENLKKFNGFQLENQNNELKKLN